MRTREGGCGLDAVDGGVYWSSVMGQRVVSMVRRKEEKRTGWRSS